MTHLIGRVVSRGGPDARQRPLGHRPQSRESRIRSATTTTTATTITIITITTSSSTANAATDLSVSLSIGGCLAGTHRARRRLVAVPLAAAAPVEDTAAAGHLEPHAREVLPQLPDLRAWQAARTQAIAEVSSRLLLAAAVAVSGPAGRAVAEGAVDAAEQAAPACAAAPPPARAARVPTAAPAAPRHIE